jgi:hypothetical protein
VTAAGLPVEAPAPVSHDPAGSTMRSGIRSRWWAGVRSATRVIAASPASWPIGLAGLLARGAVVVFILPVVVLPTPTGLATQLGPAIISVALAGPNPAILMLAVAAGATAAGLVVAGGLVGAVADVALIRRVAASIPDRPVPELPGRSRPTGPDGQAAAGLVGRVFAVRLVAHVPLVIALVVGTTRIVDATYAELISPGDLAVPLVIRVVQAAPEAVAAIVLAWLAGETIGGLAARGLVLWRRSLAGSLGWAVGTIVRHPLATVATLVLGLAGVVIVVIPALALAVVVWGLLRPMLLDDGPLLLAIGGAVVFAATWLASLLLAGVGASWRSALWTVEVIRRHAAPG